MREVCACLALCVLSSWRERGNVGLETRGREGAPLKDHICPSFPSLTGSCANASTQTWSYHTTKVVLLAEASRKVLVSCDRGCYAPAS